MFHAQTCSISERCPKEAEGARLAKSSIGRMAPFLLLADGNKSSDMNLLRLKCA